MRVIIDRRFWLRGENESCLYRERDGNMCCLGFACLQAGFTVAQIKNLLTPVGVLLELPKSEVQNAARRLVGLVELSVDEYSFDDHESDNTNECFSMMQINDATEMPDTVREAKLIEWGLRAGIEFVFEG